MQCRAREMAKPHHKITDICRLCLTEELNLLIPTNHAFDSSLTSADVVQFTGVQIPIDEDIPYVICTDCLNRLRESINFRNSCVRNDRLYQQILAECIDDLSVDTDEEIHFTIVDINDEFDSDNAASIAPVQQQPLLQQEHSSTHSPAATKCDKANGDDGPPAAQSNEKRSTGKAFAHPKRLCDICGQTTTCYKKHLLTHTKVKEFACPHCHVQMTDSSNLTRHIQAVHMKLVIRTCKICDKEFKHHNSYNTHMRAVHNIGEKYKCKICPKTFNSTRAISFHVQRVHTYDKNYECKICQKRFKTGMSLRKHKRVHSDERPYACSLCPKQFKSSFGRNTHQLTHTGVSFSCLHCEKRYRYKAQLSMHMRKRHAELVVGDDASKSGVTE